MDEAQRTLTKRPRAYIACNNCRQAKAKCDGNMPICERCTRLKRGCVYVETVRDKRLERQAERKATLELRKKVKELEAQLAASQTSPTALDENESAQPVDRRSTIGSIFDNTEGESAVMQGESVFSEITDRQSVTAASDAESPVDVLAAGVFENPLSGFIYYFGSSSNHAQFWSLTASFTNLGHRSRRLFKEPLRPVRDITGQVQGSKVSSDSRLRNQAADQGEPARPARETAIKMISRFFDTIGAILPYVSEPALLDSLDRLQNIDRAPNAAHIEQPSVRTTRALLNIVYAHALSTMSEQSPEPFYRRTLNLLSQQTLYTPSLELIQTLLLLSIYQQNHQRSTESWTPHSLAVKAAYQLGIHSPSLYEYARVQEKELRSRLWFAIVNQDRMLSTNLGQPSLIPAQHVRMEIMEMLVTVSNNRTVETAHTKENLAYFRNTISLHEIMGSALDSIYDSNISTSSRCSFSELISITLNLSMRLERWRDNELNLELIGSDISLSSWTTNNFLTQRHSILISILYYKTTLTLHGSLLMSALELATNGSQEVASSLVRGSVISLLKVDFLAARDFHHLIRGLLLYQRSFFNANATWWLCNYAALTLCLHVFAFWIASMNPTTAFLALDMESSVLENMLRDCLETLKAIGTSSFMSLKAHRCLCRHFEFLKSIASEEAEKNTSGENERPSTQGLTESMDSALFPYEEFGFQDNAYLMENPPAEIFGNLNAEDFMFSDPVDLGIGISNFDAAGFV